MMKTPVSLSVADGTATLTAGDGRVYTATGITFGPGDVIGVECNTTGLWLTVDDGGQVHRYPLRHGDDPHLTELKAMTIWPNPIFPGALA